MEMGEGPAYPLNRPKPRKLLLQVVLGGIVAQTRHDQRLERVAADVGILVGLDCIVNQVSKSITTSGQLVLTFFRALCQQLLGLLLALPLLAVLHLQPALSRVIDIRLLVRLQGRQELRQSRDGLRLAVLRRVIRRFEEPQGRPGREERQEIRRELVRHDVLSHQNNRRRVILRDAQGPSGGPAIVVALGSR